MVNEVYNTLNNTDIYMTANYPVRIESREQTEGERVNAVIYQKKRLYNFQNESTHCCNLTMQPGEGGGWWKGDFPSLKTTITYFR